VAGRRKRCGQCAGCKMPDCGQCVNCKDMRKFGGTGRKKKACSQRKCSHEHDTAEDTVTHVIDKTKKVYSLSLLMCMWEYNAYYYCCVLPLLSQNAEHTTSTPLFTYLEAQKRQISCSVGDGNCLFRCFSYQLLGTEDEHIAVHSLLVRFENLNQSSFQPYLTSINPPTMKQHINDMLRPNKWGTHIEILAAATYYQIPVYYCCLGGKEDDYHWECVNPLQQQQPFRYPDLTGSPLDNIQPHTHFELSYTHNCHYDSVVASTGELSTDFPSLRNEETYVMEVL